MEVPNASLNQPKLEMFRNGAQLSKCLLQLQNKTKFKTWELQVFKQQFRERVCDITKNPVFSTLQIKSLNFKS